MSRFGERPEEFFVDVYRETAPWDIGAPQPALIDLLHRIPPAAPVLDVGCGPGDLAIALAEEGHRVLGVDFVPTAIDEARRRAGRRTSVVQEHLEFRVADALRPSRLGSFGAVVDSGFFHLFEPEEGDRFVEDLTRALDPGGRYYLLAFAVTFPIPNSPRAVTEEEIRARFMAERGWEVRECRAAEFLSRIAPVPAVCACLQRAPHALRHGGR